MNYLCNQNYHTKKLFVVKLEGVFFILSLLSINLTTKGSLLSGHVRKKPVCFQSSCWCEELWATLKNSSNQNLKKPWITEEVLFCQEILIQIWLNRSLGTYVCKVCNVILYLCIFYFEIIFSHKIYVWKTRQIAK